MSNWNIMDALGFIDEGMKWLVRAKQVLEEVEKKESPPAPSAAIVEKSKECQSCGGKKGINDNQCWYCGGEVEVVNSDTCAYCREPMHKKESPSAPSAAIVAKMRQVGTRVAALKELRDPDGKWNVQRYEIGIVDSDEEEYVIVVFENVMTAVYFNEIMLVADDEAPATAPMAEVAKEALTCPKCGVWGNDWLPNAVDQDYLMCGHCWGVYKKAEGQAPAPAPMAEVAVGPILSCDTCGRIGQVGIDAQYVETNGQHEGICYTCLNERDKTKAMHSYQCPECDRWDMVIVSGDSHEFAVCLKCNHAVEDGAYHLEEKIVFEDEDKDEDKIKLGNEQVEIKIPTHCPDCGRSDCQNWNEIWGCPGHPEKCEICTTAVLTDGNYYVPECGEHEGAYACLKCGKEAEVSGGCAPASAEPTEVTEEPKVLDPEVDDMSKYESGCYCEDCYTVGNTNVWSLCSNCDPDAEQNPTLKQCLANESIAEFWGQMVSQLNYVAKKISLERELEKDRDTDDVPLSIAWRLIDVIAAQVHLVLMLSRQVEREAGLRPYAGEDSGAS